MPSGSYSINTRWYLEVNRLARQTPWAHGFMALYSHFLGLGLLALTLLAAWWTSRSSRRASRAVAGVLWAAGGTVVAWVVAHFVLKPVVAERRPYLALAHVEVLLTRTHGYSFPSGHATVAGAVIAGLLLARRPIAATIASVLGLFFCFGRVYTGMHYPFDVLGGLAVGAVVMLLTFPVAVPLLDRFDRVLLGTPLRGLVQSANTRPIPRHLGRPERALTEVPTPVDTSPGAHAPNDRGRTARDEEPARSESHRSSTGA